MKKQLLLILIGMVYAIPVSAKTGIEGKWKPYDISISIDGIPNAISSAIAIQIKEDPSTECVRNSIIEVQKSTFTFTNACEENGDQSGTWKLNGDKLTITLSKYPDKGETITITSMTDDLIAVDITDKIPNDFEFNGIKISSVQLILKRM